MKKIIFFFLLGFANCFAQSFVIEKINSNPAIYDQYLETDE